ncbi:MAG TPA: hypothetical protein PLW75_02800 [Hyphomicrobium sp.]|nr:hypothetical protein [Hyphomicrobium sp.]
MFARRLHVDGGVIVETHALLRRFSVHRTGCNVHQIGANPAAALQIGGRSYAPSAASFLAVSMQEIGAFSAKSKIGILGEKGRIFGGQDKRTWHYVAHVLEIIIVCTLFRWCESGTPFFIPLVPRFRAKPWLCWFSTSTMAAERPIFGSFGRDATMSGDGKVASSRSPIFPARYGNGAT